MAKTVNKTVDGHSFKVNAATGLPMGRPPVDKKRRKAWEKIRNEAKVAQLHNEAPPIFNESTPVAKPEMTDAQKLKAIQERFEIMATLAAGACEGSQKSVIVSGSGGTGKTYTINEIVEKYAQEEGVKVESYSGVVTPINLYLLLYENCQPNAVTVLDDADGIFFNSDSLSLLKAAMDTKPSRTIHWRSESSALSSNEVPKSFQYEGSLIFITNIDFQHIVDSSNNKLVPHLEALMTRAVYLDLMLHSNRDVGLWIDYLVTKNDILVNEKHITKSQQEEVLAFMAEHRDNFRNLSIRTALKLASFVKNSPHNWKLMARKTELREDVAA